MDNEEKYTYEYRGTAYGQTDQNIKDGVSIPGGASKIPDIPHFIKQGGGRESISYLTSFTPFPSQNFVKLPYSRGQSNQAGEENALKAAITEGVIFSFSSGNEAWYLTQEGDVDHNNKVIKENGTEYYIHRAPYPMGVKDDSGYDLSLIHISEPTRPY